MYRLLQPERQELVTAMTLAYQQRVSYWLKGHAEACIFIDTVFDIAHTLDDLTDRDKPVSTAQAQSAFRSALIDLPRNPFYVQHFALLNAALHLAFLNWLAANNLEVRADDDAAKDVAFILRSSYADLITVCAYIIGGEAWAVQVAADVRVHASSEGKAQYLDSLKNEKRSNLIVEGV